MAWNLISMEVDELFSAANTLKGSGQNYVQTILSVSIKHPKIEKSNRLFYL